MKKINLFLSVTACAALMFNGCSKDSGNNGGDGGGGGGESTTYTITVTDDDNGSAQADMADAKEGEIVSLIAIANPGFEFYRWDCDEVTFTDGAEVNPGKFTMPAKDITIKASFSVKSAVINGVKWALCNVDAPGRLTANSENVGMLYQWNRRTGWSAADPLTSVPEGAAWIDTVEPGTEWELSNDPCPEGWRVPTHDEHIALCDLEKTKSELKVQNGVTGRLFMDTESGSSIFLPFCDYRDYSTGRLVSDESATYWSGSYDDRFNNYPFLYISPYSATYVYSAPSAHAVNVRCVANQSLI